MELSPEEYGRYWRASFRISAGLLVFFVATLISRPLLAEPALPAQLLGVFLLIALVVAGTYLVVLGFARTVRIAVDAEMRR